MGLSLGGGIALRAYEMYPNRVKALILCDARCEADSNETKNWREDSIDLLKKNKLEIFAEGFINKIFARESFNNNPEAVKFIRNIIISSSPKLFAVPSLQQPQELI